MSAQSDRIALLEGFLKYIGPSDSVGNSQVTVHEVCEWHIQKAYLHVH